MNLLIINAGSSSLRIALFTTDLATPVRLAEDRYDLRQNDAGTLLRSFISQHNMAAPFKVAHRFVHGGAKLIAPARITPDVLAQLQGSIPLAPLHTPFALRIVELLAQEFGAEIEQVAVFDTGFFHELPAVARTYALPASICRQHDLYRYGFHGFAHQSLYRQWHSLTDRQNRSSRVITLQLGSGCSITALLDGKAVDTSMGFTPLEGLVMGTRSGDIDPGLILYLQSELGYTPGQLNHLLNEQSGLLGISGEDADMRILIDNPGAMAQLAIDIFCYRVRKYIGSYLAALGGADAIVFGGGIGENLPQIRSRILDGMQWCGIEIDAEKNQSNITHMQISKNNSNIEVWMMKTDEEQLIAEAACSIWHNNE